MADASTFTSNVPVPYVDETGCHIPAFEDIYAGLIADYQGVYGSDVSIDEDDQDGQWLGIQAAAFNKVCAAFLAAYNAFSPATGQGVGLSSVVKTNGITRKVAGFSTVDVTVVGTVGAILSGIEVSDGTYKWALPDVVVIPPAGQIDVTATCLTPGAIVAGPGAVSLIQTVTKGLQTISNTEAATPGAPVETDPQLKTRQSNSTMLAATGVVDGIYGAIEALPNVARLRLYENDTSIPDANGIPGHTICAVVDGGDVDAIAQTIAARKLSAGTFGTTSVTVVTGAAAIPRQICFFRPDEPVIFWEAQVRPLKGFTSDIATQIKQALADWTNAIGIGAGATGRIMLGRAWAPADLTGPASNTFELIGLTLGRSVDQMGAQDVPIAFNEAPSCVPDFVTITPVTS